MRTRASSRFEARLHPGAMEHYENGAAYDRRYEGRSEDVAFYEKLVKPGTRVLEYGAGTGRLTLPLAARGASVHAVDLSSAMLERLAARVAAEPASVRKRVSLARGDMRTFSTTKRFDLVVCGFHTFCHLYTLRDVVEFLARVRQHLAPRGTFAFDVPVPRIDAAGYEILAEVCVTEMDGPKGPELLTQRWYQPEELRMHLAYGGFEEVRFFGDFSSSAPDEDSDFLAIRARRGASRARADAPRKG